MCNELWRYERARAAENAARQKAAELIDKARSARPVPPAEQEAPAAAGQEPEQETVPA